MGKAARLVVDANYLFMMYMISCMHKIGVPRWFGVGFGELDRFELIA